MINKAILVGRITKKLLKSDLNGKVTCSLIVVTECRNISIRHTVDFYDKLATVASKVTNIGDMIYLEGEINVKNILEHNIEKTIYFIAGGYFKVLPSKSNNENRGNVE